MCRNIRRLYNFEPPATAREIQAAAEQFVRKVSGSAHASKANREACALATEEISDIVEQLLNSLVTRAPARPRTGPDRETGPDKFESTSA